MSYEQKYLKYKQKYLELKKQLEMNGDSVLSPNDISVNTDSVLNLTTTPNGQTGGFLGMFNSKSKSKPEPSQSPVSVAEPVPETELNLTETPDIESKEVNNTSLPETNQKIYTEVNLGPEANMKNVVISNKEQSGGGIFGKLGSAPAPNTDNTPCSGTVNSVNDGVVGSETMKAAAEAAAKASEQAAATEAAAEAAAKAAEQAAEAAAVKAAAEQDASEAAAAEAAAAEAAAAEAAAAEAAAAKAAAAEPDAPVLNANSKYSVDKSEVNNTEDIERLFSQLGGDFHESSSSIFESSSSIFSSSDGSVTLTSSSALDDL